jgi:NAD(P)-dependent dehydrogenase (short-subunit alcohol dehydrogenase family)
VSSFSAPSWLAGETAIVTGAGAGIGRATALLLAEAGALVIAADRAPDAARATADEIGASARALELDVSDGAAVRAAINKVHGETGRVDILVNNAGVYPMVALNELDDAIWDRTLGVNLRGACYVMQAAAQLMRSGGRIVNISSIDSLRPSAPGLGHYGASKAALNALTRSAAVEYGPLGIRVNALLPGVIATEGTSGTPPEYSQAFADRAPARRLGTPTDIARAALFLVSPLAEFMHGHAMVVDGGLSING